MASSDCIDRLVNTIAYEFRDRSLLVRALTAPGAEGDKEGTEEEQVRYQGNRLLAQVGKSLLQLIVETTALSEGGSKRGMLEKCKLSAIFTPSRRYKEGIRASYCRPEPHKKSESA